MCEIGEACCEEWYEHICMQTHIDNRKAGPNGDTNRGLPEFHSSLRKTSKSNKLRLFNWYYLIYT